MEVRLQDTCSDDQLHRLSYLRPRRASAGGRRELSIFRSNFGYSKPKKEYQKRSEKGKGKGRKGRLVKSQTRRHRQRQGELFSLLVPKVRVKSRRRRPKAVKLDSNPRAEHYRINRVRYLVVLRYYRYPGTVRRGLNMNKLGLVLVEVWFAGDGVSS